VAVPVVRQVNLHQPQLLVDRLDHATGAARVPQRRRVHVLGGGGIRDQRPDAGRLGAVEGARGEVPEEGLHVFRGHCGAHLRPGLAIRPGREPQVLTEHRGQHPDLAGGPQRLRAVSLMLAAPHRLVWAWHRHLVAQHEQLDVLGCAVAGELGQHRQNLAQQQAHL